MQLTPTAEDYVKAIFQLSQEQRVARVKDLARHLQVKMPSVVAALKSLARRGLVHHEPYGYVELTERGKRIAEQLSERHRRVFSFLQHVLGLAPKQAQTEACKIEHYLSPATVERLGSLSGFLLQLSESQQRELRALFSESERAKGEKT